MAILDVEFTLWLGILMRIPFPKIINLIISFIIINTSHTTISTCLGAFFVTILNNLNITQLTLYNGILISFVTQY